MITLLDAFESAASATMGKQLSETQLITIDPLSPKIITMLVIELFTSILPSKGGSMGEARKGGCLASEGV